jgi:hypothetical protein
LYQADLFLSEERTVFSIKTCQFVQIEALKDVGVTEVVLAINYRPEVKKEIIHLHCRIT